MRAIMQDGAVFDGPSEKEIVSQMRKDEWGGPALKRDYMLEVKERVESMVTGANVRTETPADFLASLASIGLCRIEESVGA